MLKTDLLELQGHEFFDGLRILRLGIARRIEDLLKIRQRYLRLAIDVDDVSQFLQRGENVKRKEHQREELADGDLLAEDQVQHHEQNAGAQRVDRGPLNETQAAQVLHFLKFEF